MELIKIEQLIEKYHNGQTNIEEERLLREFLLKSQNIPTHLLPEKELFTMLNDSLEEDIPFNNFMSDLESIIDEQALISIKHKNRNHILWITGIAASIVLMIGTYLMFFNQPTYGEFEITNEQLAYEETQKALLFISQNLNKGTMQLSKINKLDKPIENLNNLNKLNLGLGKMQALEYLNNTINKN